MKILVRYNINEFKKTLDAILTDGTTINASRIEYYSEQIIYVINMANGLGGIEMQLIGDCEILKSPDQEIMLLILRDLSHDIIYLVSSDELNNYFKKK